jgi:hypothetical protein
MESDAAAALIVVVVGGSVVVGLLVVVVAGTVGTETIDVEAGIATTRACESLLHPVSYTVRRVATMVATVPTMVAKNVHLARLHFGSQRLLDP